MRFVELLGAERLVQIQLDAKPVVADEVLEVARDVDPTAAGEILGLAESEQALVTRALRSSRERRSGRRHRGRRQSRATPFLRPDDRTRDSLIRIFRHKLTACHRWWGVTRRLQRSRIFSRRGIPGQRCSRSWASRVSARPSSGSRRFGWRAIAARWFSPRGRPRLRRGSRLRASPTCSLRCRPRLLPACRRLRRGRSMSRFCARRLPGRPREGCSVPRSARSCETCWPRARSWLRSTTSSGSIRRPVP